MTQDAIRGSVVLDSVVVAHGTNLPAPVCDTRNFVTMAAGTWHMRKGERVTRFGAASMAREAVSRRLMVIVVAGLAQGLIWTHCRRLVARCACKVCRPVGVVREVTYGVRYRTSGCSARSCMAASAVHRVDRAMVAGVAIRRPA